MTIGPYVKWQMYSPNGTSRKRPAIRRTAARPCQKRGSQRRARSACCPTLRSATSGPRRAGAPSKSRVRCTYCSTLGFFPIGAISRALVRASGLLRRKTTKAVCTLLKAPGKATTARTSARASSQSRVCCCRALARNPSGNIRAIQPAGRVSCNARSTKSDSTGKARICFCPSRSLKRWASRQGPSAPNKGSIGPNLPKGGLANTQSNTSSTTSGKVPSKPSPV